MNTDFYPNSNPHLWLAAILSGHDQSGSPTLTPRLNRIIGWSASSGLPVVLLSNGDATIRYGMGRLCVLEGDTADVTDAFDAWVERVMPEAVAEQARLIAELEEGGHQ